MKPCIILSILYLFITPVLSTGALAQDRVFTYTYQSSIASPGEAELEVWNTIRWQRAAFYRAFDHRIEFELGVAEQLQTSFYLNIGSEAFVTQSNVYSTDATGRLITTQTPTMQTDRTFSFSNEWKYRLASPVAGSIGFALYGEATIGDQSTEIETKLILDKLFGEYFTALNLTGELESETTLDNTGATTSDRDYRLEVSYGLTRRVGNGFHIGFEAVNVNTFSAQEWEHSALFAGPTVSFAAGGFGVNFTILPQVRGLRGSTENGLVLDEEERLHTRLLFSYEL